MKQKINLNPDEIRFADLRQKKLCLMQIEKIRKAALLYAVIFCIGVAAYVCVYSFTGLSLTLMNNKLYPSLNLLMYIVPFIVIIPSYFAVNMSKYALPLAVLAYFVVGIFLLFTAELINAWVVIPAGVGIYFYVRLWNVYDSYIELKNQEGFPYFTNQDEMRLEAGVALTENIEKEPQLNLLTEIAIKEFNSSSDKTIDKT